MNPIITTTERHDEATVQELIDEHGLTFPVGHSADADAVNEATGAFVNDDPHHLQSTGFVLDPAGNVVAACTPAARSDASCPTTWSVSCAICASPPPGA